MTYKVGDSFLTEYENPPVSKEQQYKMGQKIEIRDSDLTLLAKFEVTDSNEQRVAGKIIVTYGNKRRKNKK